jgi:Ca2+-binding RTX toxin-like protein
MGVPRAPRSLALETLEERRVLAATLGDMGGTTSALLIDMNYVTGVKTSVRVEHVVRGDRREYVQVIESVNGRVTSNQSFLASQVRGILYMGGAADDTFFYKADGAVDLRVVAWGEGGHDNLQSQSDVSDVLMGGGGNDTLAGGKGNDVLYGEAGNDALSGGAGDDKLFGGSDRDNLDGGADNDYLDGGQEGIADGLRGGTGVDTFVAEFHYINRIATNIDRPIDLDRTNILLTTPREDARPPWEFHRYTY